MSNDDPANDRPPTVPAEEQKKPPASAGEGALHRDFPSSGPVLAARLADAQLMISHAAEVGREIKPDLVETIEKAREAYAKNAWTVDFAKQFWPAYSQICALIKPVTAESLAACISEGLRRTLDRYRFYTVLLALILVPVSIIMFINTSISNEIGERIKENDALAVSLRDQLLTLSQAARPAAPDAAGVPAAPVTGPQRNERDTVVALQNFATANRFLYGRALLLDHFIMNAEPDPFKRSSPDEKRAALELPVKLPDIPGAGFDKIEKYQVIRAFAKNVQQMNLVIYGAITAYLLPILYALLGALAYALRSLSEQTNARTYTPSYAAFARIIIAAIAGLVVGLFSNFTQGISLSPLAIAFLVGYAVEIFFSFLDAFLETLKKVRS